jgi:hypothetical protein
MGTDAASEGKKKQLHCQFRGIYPTYLVLFSSGVGMWYTQFTCITIAKKVRILTPEEVRGRMEQYLFHEH